jgi:hypothetical protein
MRDPRSDQRAQWLRERDEVLTKRITRRNKAVRKARRLRVRQQRQRERFADRIDRDDPFDEPFAE